MMQFWNYVEHDTWKEFYVAALRGGADAPSALRRADEGVEALRERKGEAYQNSLAHAD
jgi:pyridoxal biosynthesis lyase PdxS